MLKRTIIGSLVLALLIGLVQNVFLPVPRAAADDMDVLKMNIVDFFTYAGLDPEDSYVKAARKFVNDKTTEYLDQSRTNRITANGSFADYNYSDIPQNGIVPATNHYNRLLFMASSYRMEGGPYYMNAALKEKIELGLTFINSLLTVGSQRGGNWFEWEIGTPRRMGPTLILMQGFVDSTLMNQQIATLGYMITEHLHGWDVAIQGAGTNDIWTSTSHTYYAALSRNTERMEDVYDFICDRIIPNGDLAVKEAYPPINGDQTYKFHEFIKPDFSYHAHANILYNGGYGDSFMRDAVKLQLFLKNTPYAITERSIKTLVDYTLEGYGWMIKDRYIDMSASGREPSLKSMNGNVGFWGMLALISLPDVPRRNELIAMSKRMFAEFGDRVPVFNEYDHFPGAVNVVKNSPISAQVLIGHKHFQYSDFTVHRDANFYASVKMQSRRTKSSENTSNQGKKFYTVADGTFYLLYTGKEYWDGDTRAAMNWARLPGTTVEVFDREVNDYRFSEYGEKNYAGGAYNDKYGVSAFDFGAQGSVLEAKKSYFFFDNEIVFLGSDINTPSNNKTETIVTQWPLSAANVPLYVNGTNVSSAMGYTSTLNGVNWAQSDNTGYYFPGGQTIEASRVTQTGTWFDLRDGQNYDNPVSGNFLTLAYNHGTNASNQSYSYAVVPNVNDSQMAAYAGSSPYTVLAQNSSVHAVKDASTNAVGAAFWTAGNVDIVSVDTPSIVYYKENGNQFELALNNPEHTTKTITVTVNKRLVAAQLPTGVTMTPNGSETILTFNTELGNNYLTKFTVEEIAGLPTAPTGFTAVAGNQQVALSWNAVNGATSYTVKRSTTSGSGYTTVQSGITGTSFADTGRTNGTTYYYVVTATNTNGTGANSFQVSAAPVAPPPAPTGLSAIAGNGQVALSWNTVTGATYYSVKRSTTIGSGYTNVQTGITGTSLVDSGRTNGATYYYVVTATNASGTSSDSIEASATPAEPPRSVVFHDTFDSLATGSKPPGWTWQTVGSTAVEVAEKPTATDKSLFIWDGSSNPPNHATPGIVSATRPFASQSGSNVTVEWGYRGNNANAYVMNFEIRNGTTVVADVYHSKGNIVWRSDAGSDTNLQATAINTWYTIKLDLNTDTKTYDIYVDGVLKKSGTPFRNASASSIDNFRVISGAATVIQSYVDNLKVSVPMPLAPPVPTSLTAEAGKGQISLGWNASAGATSYTIKRATTDGGPYTVVQSGITTTGYVDADVAPGTTYYYVVAAVNGSGESVISAQAQAVPIGPEAILSGGSLVHAGRDIYVGLKLANVTSNVYGQDITLYYNANEFELVALAPTHPNTVVAAVYSAAPGLLRIVTMTTAGVDDTSNFLGLVLRAKPLALSTTARVEVLSAQLGLASGNVVNVPPSEHAIRIYNADLTGSNGVNVGDLAVFAPHYRKNTSSPDWNIASKYDLNGDGTVDLIDLVLIATELLR
ncbi:polysaccharide lyase family 8 super-sandwich domain-containing protein [Paenibacillus koleovorans]|uniref:polysaccharide lyase family 8 super-sandwich domain-containing protein n=1 Tax=Paenibacillus koleovorans TaxID=121608 RepID=UPI000FDC78C9|nr:polysaccharide lyase family 8 super-sandwich domain-containing protein [Paenibacillus koleovorans]